MDRQDFMTRATASLEHLDQALGDLEHEDLDVELAGEVLTLTFGDGTRYVINAHGAARQIWMAAERQAWHFDFDEPRDAWVASKTDDELLETVGRVVGRRLGLDLQL